MFEAVTITRRTFFSSVVSRGGGGRGSNEIYIGATMLEHEKCESERGRHEALLGWSGGILPRENFEISVLFGGI